MMNAGERVAALGVSFREYVDLAQQDARLFASPVLETEGAVVRCKRWLAAGRPAPDFARLVFRGDSTVREILVETLAKFPTAIAWHLVEWCIWRETGRSSPGWMAPALVARTPSGDTAHEISIDGNTSDAALPHLLAHEASHSWHRAIIKSSGEPSRAPEPIHEFHARVLLVYNYDADAAARCLLRVELLADETARALGWPAPPGSSDYTRLRGFRDDLEAASDRAAEISVELGLDKKDG
jgi:hypothetical protein